MKTYIIFTIFLLVGIFTYSQEASFLKECQELSDEGEYEKIIQVLDNNSKAFENLTAEDKMFFSYYLAIAHGGLGNFDEAEQAFQYELTFGEKLFGKNTWAYYAALSDFAWFYFSHGYYAKALNYYKEMETISEQIGIENDEADAVLYDNIAKTNELLGNIAVAAKYYERAKDIYRDKLGEEHPSYLMFIDNLAVFYNRNGREKDADFLFMKVIQLLFKLDNPPIYMNYLANDIGLWAFNKGEYEISDIFFQSLYEIIMSDVSYYHADMYHLLTLTEYYNWKKDFSKTQKLVLIINQYYNMQMKNNALLLEREQREAFWNTLKPVFELFKKVSVANPSTDLISLCYNNQLVNKSILLNYDRQVREIIHSSNENIKSIYDSYRQTNDDLFRLYQIKKTEDLSHNIEILNEKSRNLGEELIQKIQPFIELKENITWKDIQSRLAYDEVAIEFMTVNYNNSSDGALYYALLLSKNSESPKFIPLFEEKQLDDLFEENDHNYDIYRASSRNPTKTVNYGERLYELIWKPLEPNLKNIRKIYYSPSGKLNLIAFAAIPVDNNSVLMEKYDLYQLTSTREIILNDDMSGKIKNVTLFGGISYDVNDADASKVFLSAEKETPTTFTDSLQEKKESFKPLNATLLEVENIGKILNNMNVDTKLYIDIHATEKSFKDLDGKSTDIIHIATHGFYLPQTEVKKGDFHYLTFSDENKEIAIDNPLLYSGLALAGANRAWKGEMLPKNWEDGILTSHEISQMDLSNTKLVVLSACETGLGYIDGDEGVFGLQRAFKMAGVQTILMSLWPVPDKTTADLMELFYRYWLIEKLNKHDAFKKAQREIRSKNPADIQSWAAFVMID